MALFHMKFFVSLAYCLPSFVIYTLVIVMMLRNWKEFNSAFFRIVVVDYFFNLLTYLNSMITLRVPNNTGKDCLLNGLFAMLGKDSPYTSFLFFNYFLNFGNAYFQYSMVVLMSLNRATSIFFFLINEKIWTFALPILLGIIILITTYCTRTVLANPAYFIYSDILDMYSIRMDASALSAFNNVINFMTLAVSASIILNIVSVIRLKMIQNKISTVERNLLLVTIFSSLVQGVAVMNTFLLQSDVTRSGIIGQIAQIMLPFSSDALTIGQPFILIFLSSKVRNGFLTMYFSRWFKGETVNGRMFTRTNGPASTTRSSHVTKF